LQLSIEHLDIYYTERYNHFVDNRSAILKSALELFAARGYDAVGVQEVAESAGITKPTLYHYYGSKQGLFQALLDTYYEQFIQAIRQAAAYQGDLPRTLETLARAYFEFARQNPVYYRMQLAMYFAPRHSDAFQMIAKCNEQQQQIVEELFLAATRNHGNMRGRHRLYASTFIGMLNTCISLWLNGYVELDDALVHRTVHQFQHGIYS
jgi:AcrR family transcriptional regulator